uniref:bifunctional aminoglycoside phosphotransferase/ATP-binding protein n=1 Tax=Bordetella sputigena TaxID=1416810 RepID=UPI0039EF9065
METHISVVYLVGRYAYKFCKPVDLGFVDFTALSTRWRCCNAAARSNRRLAPSIYLGVVPVRREGRVFKVDVLKHARARREGPSLAVVSRRDRAFAAVEYALKMRRFDTAQSLSAIAARGMLRIVDIERLAQRLAAFHLRASRKVPAQILGSARLVQSQVTDVLSAIERLAPGATPDGVVPWCREALAGLAQYMDERRARGFVRECHGDLHLDNMVRRGNTVECFDCVDFSDALRWTDVTADIAFVVMDLLAHGRGELATRLLNRWLSRTGDYGALAGLRFYVLYRALVRALAAALKPRARRDRTARVPMFETYLDLARRITAPPRPMLLLCHGYSGSGKSVASEALAPMLGAIRISSDIERKRTDAPAPLPGSSASLYERTAIDGTYERLRDLAGDILAAGYPVIVDATFLRRAHRASFMALADTLSVPVFLIDFQADPRRLSARLTLRAQEADQPSDADAAVLRLQRTQADTLTQAECARTIKVSTDVPLGMYETPRFWDELLYRTGAFRGWLLDAQAPAGRHEP